MIGSSPWFTHQSSIPRTQHGWPRTIVSLCLMTIFTVSAQSSHAILARQQNGQDTSKPSSDSKGMITGRIVTDDGRMPTNAKLFIEPIGKQGASDRAPAVTIDEAGNFRISGLASGFYTLRAFLEGYWQVNESTNDNPAEGLYRPGDVVTIKMIKGGVITGRVTNSRGEPVVAVMVQALHVATPDGAPAREDYPNGRQTDDRGIYRIFGLKPGTYVVRVGGRGTYRPLPYESYAPTYHPSSSRDEATLVTVRSGEEASGINIQFRAERGHQLSGTITGAVPPSSSSEYTEVALLHAASGTHVASGALQSGTEHHQFAFQGLADGEYLLFADNDGNPASATAPRRVTIKGADSSGIELSLIRLSSITGRLMFEAAANNKRPSSCPPAPQFPLETALISAQRDQPGIRDGLPIPTISFADDRPEANGEFSLTRLEAGRYYFGLRLPTENWFVRAITQSISSPAKQPRDAGREGVTLKTGERVEGITITLTEGAASVRGRIVADKEGARLPARLRVHLVPAESTAADDLLRYAQIKMQADGSFAFTNLAPGRYWLIARPITDDESTGVLSRPLVWDSNERAKLRREAEAAKVEIELQACQRVNDYTLRYAAATKSK